MKSSSDQLWDFLSIRGFDTLAQTCLVQTCLVQSGDVRPFRLSQLRQTLAFKYPFRVKLSLVHLNEHLQDTSRYGPTCAAICDDSAVLVRGYFMSGHYNNASPYRDRWNSPSSVGINQQVKDRPFPDDTDHP